MNWKLPGRCGSIGLHPPPTQWGIQMLGLLLQFREHMPGIAKIPAAVMVRQTTLGGIVAAFLILCPSYSWAQNQRDLSYSPGQPIVIVNRAKILPAMCTGEWEVSTVAGSNTWRGPKDWVRATFAPVRKQGVTSITIRPTKGKLTAGRPITLKISGKLTNACQPGYFQINPLMTLEIKRNNRTVLVSRAGQVSRRFAVPVPVFFVKQLLFYNNADIEGKFNGGRESSFQCCLSGSFNVRLIPGRNIAKINFAKTKSKIQTIQCTQGRWYNFLRVTGRLADPDREGHYRLDFRLGKPKSTTHVCSLNFEIPSAPSPKNSGLLLPSMFKGFGGRWMVNANGYIFVVDIIQRRNRISGFFRGITNKDSSISSISGSVRGKRIQFTRSRAATRNHPPQPYTGRIVRTNTGRWMKGTFKHRGGTYQWCAVDAVLVTRGDRSKWSDCTIGGRPAMR